VSGTGELLAAIRRGDAKSVGDLLAADPDLVNASDEHGNSPLLIATYTGRHDIVGLLLERGARASFEGRGALEIAVKHGRHEAARLLGG
jgi:ankyrin repeat protein